MGPFPRILRPRRSPFSCATLFRLALLVAFLAVPAGALVADEPGGSPPASGADQPGDKPPGEKGGDKPDPGDGGGAKDGEGDDPDLFDSPTTFTDEQVKSAISRGVVWLKSKQNKDGSWVDLSSAAGAVSYSGEKITRSGMFPPGLTALALYTLLKCKVSMKDPAVKRGFASIKTRKLDVPESSYCISMLLLACCATADTAKSTAASEKVKPKLTGEYRGWAQKLADALLEKRKRFKTTVWRYNHDQDLQATPPGGNQDLSSTQLATLALFAAHRVGVKVPPSVWEDILRYSLEQQDTDGPPVDSKDPLTGAVTTHKARGFAYIKGHSDPHEGQPTGGMTACGLANVMMARFVLTDGGRKKDQWESRSDAATVQTSVYDGLAWIQSNWSSFGNPKGHPSGQYPHYWHYALERAMDLIGNQKIGDHLWYSDIGQELINRQDSKGFWKSGTTPYEPNDVLDTCFSLLFLRRATKGNIPFPSVTGGSDEGPVDNR